MESACGADNLAPRLCANKILRAALVYADTRSAKAIAPAGARTLPSWMI